MQLFTSSMQNIKGKIAFGFSNRSVERALTLVITKDIILFYLYIPLA